MMRFLCAVLTTATCCRAQPRGTPGKLRKSPGCHASSSGSSRPSAAEPSVTLSSPSLFSFVFFRARCIQDFITVHQNYMSFSLFYLFGHIFESLDIFSVLSKMLFSLRLLVLVDDPQALELLPKQPGACHEPLLLSLASRAVARTEQRTNFAACFTKRRRAFEDFQKESKRKRASTLRLAMRPRATRWIRTWESKHEKLRLLHDSSHKR